MRHLRSSAAVLLPLLLAGHATAQAPVRRALLIGINEYPARELQRLRGAVNDVDRMAELLRSRFGFAPEHTRVLRDRQATRAAILAALEGVVRATKAGDWLYVHFSGHGSQVADLNGDERDDGKDETLVPYDGRHDGVPDIVDDELNRILARVPGTRTIVVLDCCHAGTGTRSVEIRHRFAPPDARAELYRAMPALKVGVKEAEAVELPYVVLTGAKAHVTALDGPVGGVYHGFFSYAFLRVLANSDSAATPLAIEAAIKRELRDVEAQFGGAVTAREPKVECARARMTQPFLPPLAAGAARAPWCEVEASPRPNTVLLRRAQAIALGSGWAVYPRDETRFAPGGAIASGVIEQVDKDRATLRLTRRRRGTLDLAGCRAVQIATPPARSDRVRVHLTGGSQRGRESVAARLAEAVPQIAFVADTAQARFTIDLDSGEPAVRGQDGSVRASGAVAHIARVLQRATPAADVQALANPSTAIELTVAVAREVERGVKVVPSVAAPSFVIHEDGDPVTRANSVQLELYANQPVYVTIVDVDQEGGIHVLFPVAGSQYLADGLIPGGEPVQIPDDFKQPNRAGFTWLCCEPEGLDTIRVFAASDLATAGAIRAAFRGLEAAQAAMDPEAFAAERARALGALRERLLGLATRGLRVAGVEVVDNKPAALVAPAAAAEHASGEDAFEAFGAESGAPATADWTAVALTIQVSRKE